MEDWKEVALAYLDAWNRHDAKGIASLFTGDGTYQDSASGKDPLQGEAITEMAGRLIAMFSDLHIEPTEMSSIGGDGCMIQWILRGTQTGSVNGRPPTHRTVALPGIDVIHIRNGKIQSLRGYFDRQEFSEQLGFKVLIQPQDVGPLTFGTAIHLNASPHRHPGAMTVSWIDFQPDDDIATFYNYGREVLKEMSTMHGHFGTWVVHAGDRSITLSAWSDVDAVKQISQSKAHQASIRATFNTFGSAVGSSVWVPHRINNTWVRCLACGKMNDSDKVSGICPCGADLTNEQGYL